MAKPNHIAISLDDISDWCSSKDMDIDEGFQLFLGNLNKLLELQTDIKIPIITVYLLPENADKSADFLAFSDCISDFFNNLSANPLITDNKIKISVFGKWYKLPGKTIESLKNIIESTKDYDVFFANFCVNYDGQEEIVDACKLIAKQAEIGKINAEMITKSSIKENIYSSYFMPPDVILIYGERKLSALLLWDSVDSNVVFADKSFMEFDGKDINKFIE